MGISGDLALRKAALQKALMLPDLKVAGDTVTPGVMTGTRECGVCNEVSYSDVPVGPAVGRVSKASQGQARGRARVGAEVWGMWGVDSLGSDHAGVPELGWRNPDRMGRKPTGPAGGWVGPWLGA